MTPLPTPTRADSLARQVFGILKEAVFEGKYQQGESIAEIKIAKWLNVSQATVREALVLLEQNGLVVRQKNRKTQVNRLTIEEVRDRVSMRLALEPLAAVKASAVMNSENLEKLGNIAGQMPPAEEGKMLSSTLADLEFHRYLWEITGSPILARTLEQLTTPLFAFVEPDRPDTKSSHLLLVDALREGDHEFIASSVRNHIEDAYRSYLLPLNTQAAATA